MSDPAEPSDLRILDDLARATAGGKVELVGVRFNVCGKCQSGTLHSNPSPSWMNRWTCNECGKHTSR